MSEVQVIRRALVSVYDKTGLIDLAQALHEAGIEIVSTGSTANQISSLGIPVTAVQDITGFAEALDGRVKTLHPNIHAGLLADVRKEDHRIQLASLGIEPFQLVVVNLYPFAQTVASGAAIEDCIEQIDIGGPAMVRASAKNHANVAVVVSPHRYDEVISSINRGGFTPQQRVSLATQAFQHVAQYDVEVASWLGRVVDKSEPHTDLSSFQDRRNDVVESSGVQQVTTDHNDFPSWVGAVWERAQVLRYGENPHQQAALYISVSATSGVAQAEQLHGKEMSYNNYVDCEAAYRAACDFDQPAVAIIKHANPCGIAIGSDINSAYELAHQTDPVSAFGGVIATNREVSKQLALSIAQTFTEVIVAPAFDSEALEVLRQKSNLRLLVAAPPHSHSKVEMRPISGGMLLQSQDQFQAAGDASSTWTLVAGEPADAQTLFDLEFAWRACRCVKSNAILLASNGAAVGIGMGQVNRVDSARLAVARAGNRATGSVAASDAFFPFADGLRVLIDAKVRAVVQPGGSVRDEEVFDEARRAGVTMYVTGARHFYH